MDEVKQTYAYYTIRAVKDCLEVGLYEDLENWGEDRTKWKRCATFVEAIECADFRAPTIRVDECEPKEDEFDDDCECPKCVEAARSIIVRHVVTLKKLTVKGGCDE